MPAGHLKSISRMYNLSFGHSEWGPGFRLRLEIRIRIGIGRVCGIYSVVDGRRSDVVRGLVTAALGQRAAGGVSGSRRNLGAKKNARNLKSPPTQLDSHFIKCII